MVSSAAPLARALNAGLGEVALQFSSSILHFNGREGRAAKTRGQKIHHFSRSFENRVFIVSSQSSSVTQH